jgi:peptidoglycan/xylan/chitin deacetylase (PgdA/CDA1 family)
MAALPAEFMKTPNHVSLTRIVKLGISLEVYASDAVAAFLRRLTGRAARGSCVVIYYHSVDASEQARFAKQMDQLLSYAKPIAATETADLKPGTRYVAVTFDDGFKTFYDCALPELEQRAIPAAMFVISDTIGKTFGPEGYSEQVMSLEQLRGLPDNLVTIGSHTMSHPFLPSISLDQAKREIMLSRVQLEAQLHRSIALFSFPYGGFNQELVEICQVAGYQRVFSTLPYFAFKESNEFVTGRVRVDPTDWALEFRLKLAGAYRWLPWAFELKRKALNNVVMQNMLGRKRQHARQALPQS